MSIGFSTTSIDVIELPTEIPPDMPYTIDDCSLAFHLGFKNKVMWYILQDTSKHYNVIHIPKRTTGKRIIHAPSDMMKTLLQRLHVKYLVPMQNKLGPHVTAYRKNLSAKDAVLQHIPPCEICDNAPKGKTPTKHECPKRGIFIKMDLKDFFPTTTRAWIRNYFKSIGYSHTVAGLLAGLLIVHDIPNPQYRKLKKQRIDVPQFFTGVPQGSPASGAICNLVADQRLDQPILHYLESLNERYALDGDWKWRYTRYSDDLSFTCGITPPKEERKNIVQELRQIIKNSRYQVNGKKTRIAHSYHRKALLGMVFNDKPNYTKVNYFKLRAIVHNCVTYGFDTQYERACQPDSETMIAWLRGTLNWVNQINPDRGSKLLEEFHTAVTIHERQKNDRTHKNVHCSDKF